MPETAAKESQLIRHAQAYLNISDFQYKNSEYITQDADDHRVHRKAKTKLREAQNMYGGMLLSTTSIRASTKLHTCNEKSEAISQMT